MSEQIKGRISQIIGAVVDVHFEENVTLPNIYDALEVRKENGEKLILECEQDIGENTMRCISMDSTDGLHRGMEVVATGRMITMPTENINGRLMNVIGESIDGIGEIPSKKRSDIHRMPPTFDNLSTSQEVFYTGIKRSVRWRWRGQDRPHYGDDPQYRQELRWHDRLHRRG